MPDLIRQRACSFRYRVVQLLGMNEYEWDEETTVTGYASSGTTREFKTLKAARSYRDKLAKERPQWPVLLQVGCLQWLSEEEATEWAEAHQGDFWE